LIAVPALIARSEHNKNISRNDASALANILVLSSAVAVTLRGFGAIIFGTFLSSASALCSSFRYRSTRLMIDARMYRVHAALSANAALANSTSAALMSIGLLFPAAAISALQTAVVWVLFSLVGLAAFA